MGVSGTGPYITTLSAASTAYLPLDLRARTTSVLLTVSTGSSGTLGIWYTLNDLNQTGVTPTWGLLSTGSAIYSSNVENSNGLQWTFLSPIGGLKMWSTAVTGTTWTLTALQSVLG